MTASYTFGTVTVATGSTTVTGSGTGWRTANVAPGFFGTDATDSVTVPVAEVISDTELRLVSPWRGASGSGLSYWLSYDTRDGQQTVNNAQRLAEYIARLDNASLSAIGGITPVANSIPVYTGPDSAEARPLSDVLRRENLTYNGFGCAHVAEGDSLTYGYGVPDPSTQSYFAIFGNLRFASGAIAKVNFAVSGSVLYTGGANPSVTSRYASSVRPYRPTPNGGSGGPRAYLYVTAGTNDIIHGRTAAQIVGDLTSYVANARADGFTVVVGTITPSTAWNPEQNDRRLSVNAAIRRGDVGADIVWGMDEIINNPSDVTICPDGGHYSVLANVLLGRYLDVGMTSGFAVKQSFGVSDAGRPVKPGWELISKITAPGGTVNVDWTGLGAFNELKLNWNIVPQGVTSGVACLVSSDNGATFFNGANDYRYQGFSISNGATQPSYFADIALIPLVDAGMADNWGSGELVIQNYAGGLGNASSKSLYQAISGTRTTWIDTLVLQGGTGRNALRFRANSGSFFGSLTLMGLR